MVEPSDDEVKDLFSLANKTPFDDRVNHQAEITDLNITLIQNYLKEVKSSLYEKAKKGDFVEVCNDMNIICNLPEYTKPKNVGLMFFSMEPDKFFPYTQIDVVQFPDGLGGNHIIEQTFKGPIHQQLREALQYIRNTIITERVVKHSDRAEADRFFNYPFAAIEEALSNGAEIVEKQEVKVEIGQTMAFVTLAFSELVHVFNIRNNKKSIFKTHPFNNKVLLGAIALSAALMLIILFIPGLRHIFSIPILPMNNVLEIILLVILPIFIVEVFKLLKINTSKDEY